MKTINFTNHFMVSKNLTSIKEQKQLVELHHPLTVTLVVFQEFHQGCPNNPDILIIKLVDTLQEKNHLVQEHIITLATSEMLNDCIKQAYSTLATLSDTCELIPPKACCNVLMAMFSFSWSWLHLVDSFSLCDCLQIVKKVSLN